MSRVGRLPIVLPSGVAVTIDGSRVVVKGPKGELERTFDGRMTINLNGNVLTIERPSDEKVVRALHGLTRSLLNNMVVGVSEGFSKELEIRGVGYKAEADPKGVKLFVGYSHSIDYTAPEGIEISVDGGTRVRVAGTDKERVGQVAAELRQVRPPEPYKGKGIRYTGEHVRSKVGKTGAK